MNFFLRIYPYLEYIFSVHVGIHIYNVLIYFSEEQWKWLYFILDKYYPIARLWGFFRPFVSIRHPDDMEVIKYKKSLILRKNYDLVRFS